MRITGFASTPEPPYYAVIFTTQRTPGDHGYREMAERMKHLAAQQAGFLGIESVRDERFPKPLAKSAFARSIKFS